MFCFIVRIESNISKYSDFNPNNHTNQLKVHLLLPSYIAGFTDSKVIIGSDVNDAIKTFKLIQCRSRVLPSLVHGV